MESVNGDQTRCMALNVELAFKSMKRWMSANGVCKWGSDEVNGIGY